MASHGISRTEYHKSRNEEVKEKERKKLKDYRALVEETQQKRSSNDYTPAALELTSKVLKINPEFYTIWNYRRQILLHTHLAQSVNTDDADPQDTARLVAQLKEELGFLIPLLMAYPKCYWIWNHRLWTLQQAGTLLKPADATRFWAKEMDLVGVMLTRDMRNFHGWFYRRIVVANIENPAEGGYKSMVKEEFEYTKRMVRGVGGMTNYSAWHQRGALYPRLLAEENKDEQERMDVLEDELELLQSAITTDPEDQSLWYYHRWLVSARDETSIAPKMPRGTRIALVEHELEWLKDLLGEHSDSRYILKALVLYVQLLQGLRKEPRDEDDDENEEEVDEAAENQQILEWLESLESLDPMRKGRYIDLGKRIRGTQ
ncbi:hypothetical protein BZA05DRAFT_412010 [Tricharina praecox]|uniref:uncharacterized protein n=1 Tax=Tricharina praecox TaxID=43433 RepID=UPI002220896C|nr:uncharacterized protein BZA05DRAFT_412010 [Tricharina praecox]KAI5842703.1 hypothetical protein BZA05DRAFT_412010 [Tricharina praecox]